MKFRASFCDPFSPKIIELGEINQDKIIDTFNNIPWDNLLEKMKSTTKEEIYYSPSLEIENIENRNGLAISAIDGVEWYIFYKRPKIVKSFFGLKEKRDEDYVTQLTGQFQRCALFKTRCAYSPSVSAWSLR